jgi:hypothetical protein
MRTPALFLLAPLLVSLLVACAPLPVEAPSVVELISRPAERALVAGLRAYDDAQYPEAERQFGRALGGGLLAQKDRAAAHKHLAFIYCTSNRMAECEAAFRAARQADPEFALSKSESGHPLWGAVYKRTQVQ